MPGSQNALLSVAFGSKEQLFGAVGAQRAASIRRARDEVPAGDIPEAVRLLVGTYEDWGDGGFCTFFPKSAVCPA